MSMWLVDSAPSVGRAMFALAFIAFDVQQLLFGDLVPGRPPAWPPAVPGQSLAVVASTLCYVLAGAAILSGRWARRAAWPIAALVFVSAVVQHLPLALADPAVGGPRTRLGKGLALCGAALGMAGGPRLAFSGRIGFGLFLVASGVQHFLFIDFVKTLVPAWIPVGRLWAQFAGLALIARGSGVILTTTVRPAGLALGLMIFTWFLTLHMPRALAAPAAAQRNEWIAVFEALAFAGVALLLTEPTAGSRSAT